MSKRAGMLPCSEALVSQCAAHAFSSNASSGVAIKIRPYAYCASIKPASAAVFRYCIARSASCSIPSPCMSAEPRKYMANGSPCAAAFDSQAAPASLSPGMSSPSHNIMPKLYWAFITPASPAFSNHSAACFGSASMPSPSIKAWPSKKAASPSPASAPSCNSFSSSAERALRGRRVARRPPRTSKLLKTLGRRAAHTPPIAIAPTQLLEKPWCHM
mmetsp:Transcript_43632/g.79549  ORF Transcript_43632/g.79549 Transcript_43632/m.79549 type:complete len:216 (+) Transcript_43632:385-1032(+)